MARGLLVVVLAVSAATCRIGDLIGNSKPAVLAVQYSDDILKDSSAFGSTALRVDTVGISNVGGGELQWSARVKNSSPWLTLDPDTGTAGQTPTLKVRFDPSARDSGRYADTVIVEAVSGTGSLSVPLEYTIYSCLTTPIGLDDSVTTSLTTADCAALHKPRGWFTRLFQINNGQVNDSLTIDVTAAFDAYVAFDTSKAATAAPFNKSDNCLGAGSDPCLYYQKLPRNGIYYVEVTSADSADTGAFVVRVLHARKPLLPDSLDQRLATDSTTPVVPGSVITQQSIVLRAVVSDPDLGDTLRLQAEVLPSGVNFDGTQTVLGAKVLNGSPAYVLWTGLTDNTSFHWRLRAVDQTGRPGDWKEFPSDPAFNVQSGHDPTFANANQYQSNGTTVIFVGDTANGTTVIFKAQVSDIDPNNQLTLQVEVKDVGTGFDSATFQQSGPVSSGGTAQATVSAPTLVAGHDYHWQARVVDNTGRPIGRTGWASFGGNAESATDFHVSQPPTQLNWVVHPGNAVAGSPIGGPPQLAAQDQNGVTITTFNGPVSIAISTRPAGGQVTLLGTTTVNAFNGVATFPNLIIDTAGVGYKLRATTGTINSAESNPFTITAAPVTQLVFTVQPTAAVAGAFITPAVKVSAEDQFGNVNLNFTGQVAMAIANNPGNPPGTLSGNAPVNAIAGVATFSNLSINKTGTGYTLRATSGTLPAATSAAFNITPGPATHLVFTVPPSGAAALQIFNPPVQVSGYDANDNLATAFTGNVTVAIGTNPPGNGILSGTLTKLASGGIATFSDLKIDKQGVGYTLTATSAPLPVVTSPAFTITPSTTVDAGQSTVLASPPTITACSSGCSPGASTASLITVTARDAGGNLVANVPASITVTGTGNSGVTGTVTTNASGVATWTLTSTVASSTPAELKIISAVINSVSITQKDTVTVNPGPPVALEFTNLVGNTTAGAAINSGSGVLVRARDQFTNTATSFNGPVTMTIAAPAGGAFAPTSTNTATASSGTANFPNLRIYQAGTGYQLRASSGTLTAGLSNTFSINAGAPNKLAFTTEPTTTAVLARIDSAVGGVVVSVHDSVGNTVPFGGTVQVIMGTNAGGGTLTGGNAIPAPTGVATFPNLRINATGAGYTLVTTSSGPALISDESFPFDIVVGPAAKLAFGQQPVNTAAGATISPAVTVRILDANNFLTSSTANVTLAITPGTGTTGAHLSGGSNVTLAAVNGVATFGTLNIDSVGTNYTLSATSTGLTGAPSAPFNITAGPASKLAFGQQPTNATAGANISPPVTVRILDANGNLTSSTANVTLAITPGTGTSGAHLSGGASVTVPASGGIASFNTLTVDSAGAGYTLRATSGTLTLATSTPFNIAAGAATQLVFTKQPTNTAAGAFINQGSGGVAVTARDAQGNTAAGFTSNVTMSIVNNAGPGGKLSGTLTVAASAGVATFSDLNINKTGNGYTLGASGGGLTSPASSGFNITLGSATQVAFIVQPTDAAGGATITPAVQVEIEDAGGNRVTTASNNVTLAITPATGTSGAHLSGGSSVTVAAVSGVATFSTLTIDSAGTNYTLTATSGALTSDISNPFSISVGAPAKLAYGQQPSSTTGGATISPAVTVRILDAGGNLTASTANVTLAITSGTGTSGAHLSGGTSVTVPATAGVANFSTLTIDSAGPNYRLTATSGVLTSATSSPFTITVGSASKLAFGQQPSSTTGGATISPAVTVRILDAGGNLTSSTANVTLAITPGTGTSGAHVSGGTTVTVPASGGVATFNTLSIDSAGTNYRLTATSGVLTSAVSNTFSITVGTAVQLDFLQQPSSTKAGDPITPAVTVEIRDAGGNRVTSATDLVTIDFNVNAGSGALSNNSVAAIAGLATFSLMSIDTPGNGYRLVAKASGFADSAPSVAFNITP